MASDQHQLLEILSDVFAGKADYHEPDIVAAFFAERPDLLRELHEPKHQVILGRRGTGKTMVLKYLSLPAQIHSLGAMGSVSSSSFESVGFYVPLAAELQPTVGPEDDEDIAPLFGHWFNLVTAVPVLDAIELLQKHNLVSEAAGEQFVSDFSTNMLGERFREIRRLREWINTQINDILSRSYLARSHSIKEQLAYEKTLPRLTSPRTFHAQISSLLNVNLGKLFSGRPRFFFLLDRFDEVSSERQNVIKDMIQSQQGQLYYVKLGVAHRDKLHLTGLTVQDYRVLNIEHSVNTETYFKFCEKVLQKRLEVIRQKVKEKSMDHMLAGIFSDPATLLPNQTFEEQTKKEGLKVDRQEAFWQTPRNLSMK